jgi:vacuolar-type H+-ATPase subunit E/Vma4
MDADALLRQAEDEIEAAWCALDAAHGRMLEAARTEAAATLAAARTEATGIVAAAREETEQLLVTARVEAAGILAKADETAGEHADVIRALTEAEREAAGEELAALRAAVDRLRVELSRVVDAAFDALPVMEATSETIDQLLEPKRGLFRRLLRRA